MAIFFKENVCKINGCTHIGDLAQLFYPEATETRHAVRKFRKTLSSNAILMKKLEKVGFNLEDEDLTPLQQEIMIKTLGNVLISFKMKVESSTEVSTT